MATADNINVEKDKKLLVSSSEFIVTELPKTNNAQHLVRSMLEAGFKRAFITKREISNKLLTPYRTKDGKFSSDTRCREIYSGEFIVRGDK